jgi:outer membrane murein-binding lipoprotein Lpp
VRRLIAAAAILAVVLVVGCQDTKKVTELQGKVDTLTQQTTDMTGQIAKLTVERDSLAKVVADFMAKYPPKGTKPPTGTKPPMAKGGGAPKPPTKK